MNDIIVDNATPDESNNILQQLVAYNNSQVPYNHDTPFMHINRCVKAGDKIIGGIISEIYWNVLHVEILWVKDEYRHQGYATALLTYVESIAKVKGCKICHLDTFDFQAKGLYEKLGYTVFGVLEDCPEGHRRYYLSKRLV